MSKYTDAKGVEYDVHPELNVGEVAFLMEEEKAAWKVDQHILMAASTMFKDMFGGVAVGPKEIHLPIAGRYIDLFIRALYPDRPPVRHNIIQTKETIELLLRYDCIVPAQRFLYLQCKWLERSELYDALVLASRLDHLPSACRIIPLGYKWYRDQPGEGLPLCPNSGKRPWSVEDAARLQPGWVWALTMASNTCQKRLSEDMEQAKEETRRPAYWRNVLGEFMANLAQ